MSLLVSAAAVLDQLHGGKGDNRPDSDFAEESLEEGQSHETEHTDDPAIAKEIAKDHLSEDEDYYDKLEQVEKTSAHPDLALLIRAKQLSDQRRYAEKTRLIRSLMRASPDSWLVDAPTGRFHGVTHVPTGFRLHTDALAIPHKVRRDKERDE